MQLKPGSVTPFGLLHDDLHQIQLLVDDRIDHAAPIGFHPNINDKTLVLYFTDFETAMAKIDHQPTYISAY